MTLRAVKPEAIEKRLKAFLYGAAGTGKTTFCASFPQAYFIDSERGCENQQYIDLLVKNGSSVFQTNDFDEHHFCSSEKGFARKLIGNG